MYSRPGQQCLELEMNNKGMRFPARPIVVFFTIAVLVCAQAAAVFGAVFERQFSYFPDESICLRIDGSRFYVEKLPPGAEFDYGCIEFFTENGRSAGEEWMSRSPDGSMGADMSKLPDGQYTVTFYHSAELMSTYRSYFSASDVHISVQNGSAVMVTPIMYERNEEFRKSARMDIAALSAYLGSTYGIQSDDPAIISLAAALTEGIADDYEKARVIHDWIAGNIWYDDDAVRTGLYEDNTALGALRLGRAVCEGYAKLNAALLRAAGIPAKFVYGYALGINGYEWPSGELGRHDSNHAWNEAFIDGRWIIIDATWDSANRYDHGRKTESGGLLNRRYFDAVPEAFSANHATADAEWELWWLPAATPEPARPFAGSVSVNGILAGTGAYNIDGSNYFRLRDIAAMLGGSGLDFGVGWDAGSRTVSIRRGEAYVPDGTELSGGPASNAMAVLPDTAVTVDGRAVFAGVYNIGGSNYFRLRDLGGIIGFSVDYDESSKTVLISTPAP
jgi:transglutaminase-like putative cysteine protease